MFFNRRFWHQAVFTSPTTPTQLLTPQHRAPAAVLLQSEAFIALSFGSFHKWRCRKKENPIKVDDLGIPLFLETPIWGG